VELVASRDHKFLIFALICAVSKLSEAQSTLALSVERQPEAEACPDAPTLRARIRRIQGREVTAQTTRYHVSFSRRGETFFATIARRNGSSQRVLKSTQANCDALAQATAVTLALLFDSDADSAARSEAVDKQDALNPKSTSNAGDAREENKATPRTTNNGDVVERARTRTHSGQPALVNGLGALGVSGVSGVLQPIAPAFVLDLGVEAKRFRITLGALWLLSRTNEYGPGSVRETLISGTSRLCYATFQARPWRVDVCSGAYFGMLHGEAAGYTRNEERRTLWLALPFELALARFSSPLGWELSGGAIVPLRRHDFQVDGLGVAYESSAIGAQLSLRAVGVLPL
jgi:hypothetical protein